MKIFIDPIDAEIFEKLHAGFSPIDGREIATNKQKEDKRKKDKIRREKRTKNKLNRKRKK